MPRPMAAGRLGIALTTARASGRRESTLAMVLPARIETTSVAAPACAVICGAAASSICGLIAMTRASGGDCGQARAIPRSAQRARSSGPGSGSTTLIRLASRPRSSQPCNKAPPILPAPTRTREAGKDVPPDGPILGLPLRFHHRRIERLAARLPGPYHELKGLIITLTRVDRAAQSRLALPGIHDRATGEQQRMAEH